MPFSYLSYIGSIALFFLLGFYSRTDISFSIIISSLSTLGTLLIVDFTIVSWKANKMIDIRYKLKEERTLFLDKIEKLDNTKETDIKKIQILYLELLNELELISLLHQESYFEDHIAKEVFNTWIKYIYELEWVSSFICEQRNEDSKAYENLEKTYKQWNP